MNRYIGEMEGIDKDVPIKGGTLKGLMDMRDGRGPEFENPWAYSIYEPTRGLQGLVQELNAIHRGLFSHRMVQFH